jgi:signal transduction histidine kinase
MPDQPILIATDHLRLKQILINLLGNAAKFTKAGRVELAVQPLDHMIRFCVTDTGIGIKPDQLPHIFDPYFQVIASANTNPNGTGLGLALVQNFVHLMGGTIVVQSVVGQGSRFQVDLPYMILAEPTLSQYRQVLV